MSPEAHARLVELDGLARASREFYEYAAAVLPASSLRERCQRLARAKAEIVALLALRLPMAIPHAAMRPPLDRELADRIAVGLKRARSGLATPEPSRLWDELQRVEAVQAAACRQVAADSPDADCRREVAWIVPLLELCRDEFATH